MENAVIWFRCITVVLVSLCITEVCGQFKADYRDAVTKSLLFLEAQRSGILPPNQRVTWRSNSALQDGMTQGVNLVGGYYDAGDNVKFGLPMAFTVTMLSWSVIEYRRQLIEVGELEHTLDAIKWGTDYLLKAKTGATELWGQVGVGDDDHSCWMRPEDMTTSRQAFKIDANDPGSDLAAETAAAMAAASMVFKNSNTPYSNTLLQHAVELFEFADKYRGKYDVSMSAAAKFYRSASGYEDELLWGAAWLYFATAQESYLQYVVNNAVDLGGTQWSVQEFSWDIKYAGVQVLMSKVLMKGKGEQYSSTLQEYKEKAEFFLCACLQKSNGYNVRFTQGGMLFVRSWNNMQYVASASFLLAVYSDYMSKSKKILQCPSAALQPSDVMRFVRTQAEYILGNNPMGMSYMVGYGTKYPLHVHHRASSMVSYKVNPTFISCKDGYADWFHRVEADPNPLLGAIVGGPDRFDKYEDERDNYEQSESTTYNTAPLVGLFARLQWSKRHRLRRVNAPPATLDPQDRDIDGGVNANSCPAIQVFQSIHDSWMSEEGRVYHMSGTLTNSRNETIRQLTVQMNGVRSLILGLSQVPGLNNTFTIPAEKTLGPNEQFSFAYDQLGYQAPMSVITCA